MYGERQGSSLIVLNEPKFPITVCLRCCIFFDVYFWYLCQRQSSCHHVELCSSLFYSTDPSVGFCVSTLLFGSLRLSSAA